MPVVFAFGIVFSFLMMTINFTAQAADTALNPHDGTIFPSSSQDVPHDAPAPCPDIVVLTTGGTIAGKSADPTATIGYTSAALSTDELLAQVPSLPRVRSRTILRTGSENMDFPLWFQIADAVRAEATRSDVKGVVVTHGTDTLEETAYFLNLVIGTDKPVVLVGAMRPSTAYSADGPLNLINAVAVAGSSEARGHGVLVVMDDGIYGARDVSKGHTVRTDAFRGEHAMLGSVVSGRVSFHAKALGRHTIRSEFTALDGTGPIPRVDIIYGYGGTPPDVIEHCVAKGAAGIVIACVGDGSLGDAIRPLVKRLASEGYPIVRASRVGNGPVMRNGEVNDDAYGTIPSGTLNPQKARILLAAALMARMSHDDMRRAFRSY